MGSSLLVKTSGCRLRRTAVCSCRQKLSKPGLMRRNTTIITDSNAALCVDTILRYLVSCIIDCQILTCLQAQRFKSTPLSDACNEGPTSFDCSPHEKPSTDQRRDFAESMQVPCRLVKGAGCPSTWLCAERL
jgi:hypothetical protein